MIPGTDDPKAPWPPEWMDPVMARIDTWAAWHSGDPDRLAAVYTGNDGIDTTGFFASEQGGFKARIRRVISNVVRYFWGQRVTQPRRRLHDPIAGDIASASADLLFAEAPKATAFNAAGEEVAEAQKVLDRIMAASKSTLLEGGETCAALSGVYMRARWDTEISDDPWLDMVAPDCGVPYFTAGRLTECTLWKVIDRNNDKVTRHLEHHRKGSIEHQVFVGTDDHIGEPVGLARIPDIAAVVDKNGLITTPDPDRLAVQYVPNMRPNRIWRDIPQAASLGVSDYSGIELLMDAIDLAYSSLMRDVDLGKTRIIVPKSYLLDHGRGEGGSFELDRELYEAVNASPDEDKGLQIEFIQADIRVEEHDAVIMRLKTDTVSSAGYSPATFGMEGDVAITATEFDGRNRRSLTTKARKVNYWDPMLCASLSTLLAIAGHPGITVVLDWPAAVAPDPKTESEKVLNWSTAEAASTETKVAELHPDWTPEQITEEVERIQKERKEAAGPFPEDPGDFRGGAFGDDDEDDPADEDEQDGKRAGGPKPKPPKGKDGE